MSGLKKKAEAEALWSALAQSLGGASVDLHRLRHLVNRGMKLINDSKEKEHFYQMAGDLIVSVPERMDQIERQLEKASYILSCYGKQSIKGRMSLSDRNEVDEAMKPKAFVSLSPKMKKVSKKVVDKYLRSLK